MPQELDWKKAAQMIDLAWDKFCVKVSHAFYKPEFEFLKRLLKGVMIQKDVVISKCAKVCRKEGTSITTFCNIATKHLKKASPLLHRIDSPFMQLEYVQSLFCGSTRSCFFQMTPCFTPFITLEMMEKCISKDMPHRREFIDSFHSYVKNLLQSYEHSDVSLIFSLDGVIRFLETGKVGEYPPEVYIPFERADRIYLLRQLLQACRTQNYRMLKENVGSLDNELYLSVNQKRGYLMFSAPVHKKLIYLDIEEPDLLFTFLDFCENLDADMFYTKEETIRKLRDLIETA